MSHYYASYDKGWVIPENFCLGPFLFSIIKNLTGFFFRWPKTPESALSHKVCYFRRFCHIQFVWVFPFFWVFDKPGNSNTTPFCVNFMNLVFNLEISDTLFGATTARRKANFLDRSFKERLSSVSKVSIKLKTLSKSHMFWYLGWGGILL